MSNELVRYEPNSFLSVGDSEYDAELMAEIAGDSSSEEDFGLGDLVSVKLPSGKQRSFLLEGGPNGDESPEEIVGVLCYVQQQSVLFESEDPSDAPPVLVSNDLEYGEQVSEVIPEEMLEPIERATLGYFEDGRRVVKWKQLPYTEFGSSSKGRAKRVKDCRLLFVLRPEDRAPLLVRVPGGSLKGWRKFWNNRPRNPRFEMATGVIRLTIETNPDGPAGPFPMVRPSVAGVLSPEEAGEIAKRFYRPLRDTFRERLEAIRAVVARNAPEPEPAEAS